MFDTIFNKRSRLFIILSIAIMASSAESVDGFWLR